MFIFVVSYNNSCNEVVYILFMMQEDYKGWLNLRFDTSTGFLQYLPMFIISLELINIIFYQRSSYHAISPYKLFNKNVKEKRIIIIKNKQMSHFNKTYRGQPSTWEHPRATTTKIILLYYQTYNLLHNNIRISYLLNHTQKVILPLKGTCRIFIFIIELYYNNNFFCSLLIYLILIARKTYKEYLITIN